MPRRRRTELIETLQAVQPTPAGRLVEPNAVYRLGELTTLLGLKRSSLSREVKEKRLRVSKRCGVYFFIGQDVLDWLRGGALRAKNEAGGNGAQPAP